MDRHMNPWLDIPLADYEGHMAMPAIGQAALIADQLDVLVAELRPASVAVIGCAGGNGFECVASRPWVQRLVGMDINPRYIELAAARFGSKIRGLELCVGDIESEQQFFQPVQLVYA